MTALQFKFEVLEYLKGGGGSIVKGVVYGLEEYETRLGAMAFAEDLSSRHDPVWDKKEAIVFFTKNLSVRSNRQEPDWYILGLADYDRPYESDSYSVDSRDSKKWLPRVGEREYSTGGRTITAENLKTVIVDLQIEVNEGDGSAQYAECVLEKYKWEREFNYWLEGYPDDHVRRINHTIDSGLAAGTAFAYGNHANVPPEEGLVPRPGRIVTWESWLDGDDAHLFGLV